MSHSIQGHTLVSDWTLSQAVYSDHVLSGLERQRIGNQLMDFKATQERLEKEIDEAQRNLDLRKAKAREGRRLIFRLENALLPLNRLPDELLSEIFIYYTCHNGASPWVLAHVSQRFRRVAFDTHKLWTAVTVAGWNKRGLAYDFYESRHRCTDVQSLQHIFSLSKKAPLDIVIERITREIASIVIQERGRWDILECYVDSFEEEKPILFSPTPPITARKAVFSYGTYSAGPRIQVPWQWLELAKPISLSIRYYQRNWVIPIDSVTWWERLEEFSFSFSLASRGRKTPETLSSLLDLLKRVQGQLVRLKLMDVSISSENPLQFPRLCEFSSGGVEGWWRIECKNITKLQCCGSLPAAPITVTYPNVRELEVRTNDISDPRSRNEAPPFDLPKVDTLVVKSLLKFPRCPKEIYHRIRRVRVHLIALGDPSLYVGMQELVNVEELEIYGGYPTVTFLERFQFRHEEPHLCPALKRVSVDLRQLLEEEKGDKDQLIRVFQAIVRSRIQTNPLHSLFVEWPWSIGGGVTEFV
ncbi:hypothetical protein FRC17_001766 [Serendipita sp. 399]|nr:hypothetical protein FRC17_001766 [Serendipita sp. 399]